MGKHDSTRWTGRPPHAGSPWQMLQRRVRSWLYPSYDCELCVGQEWWQGCYCAYHGATAPCHGPERWRVGLRKLFKMEEL